MGRIKQDAPLSPSDLGMEFSPRARDLPTAAGRRLSDCDSSTGSDSGDWSDNADETVVVGKAAAGKEANGDHVPVPNNQADDVWEAQELTPLQELPRRTSSETATDDSPPHTPVAPLGSTLPVFLAEPPPSASFSRPVHDHCPPPGGGRDVRPPTHPAAPSLAPPLLPRRVRRPRRAGSR